MSFEFYAYFGSAILSVILTGLTVLVFHKYFQIGKDGDRGPQKTHKGSVPRIGGLAIFFVLAGTLIFLNSKTLLLLMVAAFPVFFAGAIEDFTGGVSAEIRFISSLISGGLFVWITGYSITKVDVDAVNFLFRAPVISTVVTVIAISALVNAFNIIDGLNGLAAGAATIMLLGFSVLGSETGAMTYSNICFFVLAPIVGFLFWNFPFGKIFLGDGGAYLLGAIIAGLSIIMPEDNPGISPFASLMIVIFPLYELGRSAIRRASTRGVNAFDPDDRHLHSLIFVTLKSRTGLSTLSQNSLSALLTLILPLISCLWAVLFFDDKFLLLAGVFCFICLYETIIMILCLLEKDHKKSRIDEN